MISQKALYQIFKTSPIASLVLLPVKDGYVIADASDVFIAETKKVASEIIGFTMADLIQKNEINKQDDFVLKFDNTISKLVLTKEIQRFTTCQIPFFSTTTTANWIVEFVPLFNENMELENIAIQITKDISAYEQEENKLQMLASVVKNTRNGIMITEGTPLDYPGPRILYVNKAFTQITGYSESEVIGKSPRILQGPNTDKLRLKKLKNALKNKLPYEVTLANYKKNGDEFWNNFSVNPVFDQQGICTHMFTIQRDVTQQQLTYDKQFTNAYNSNNDILESIDEGFFAMDKNWIVTHWNQRAETLLKTPKSVIIGTSLWSHFPKEDFMETYQNYQKALKENISQHFQTFVEPVNAWFEISGHPTPNGISVYFKDITDRKNYEAQMHEFNLNLKRNIDKLAVSNRELEQFAYVASHDLQEPLRMVISFLSQIEKKYGELFDDKGKQYLFFAVDGAKRMRQIILDLLEFSKVGKLEELTVKVDLNILIQDIMVLLREKIKATNATIHFNNLPTLKSYKTPVLQVFRNLITNALKYHKKGVDVIIDITAEEMEDSWKFKVTDNGIGIDKEYFERIFIIFQRLHSRSEYSGNGIGLSICKKIIENMEGTIWVESTEGKGSSFIFTLKKSL